MRDYSRFIERLEFQKALALASEERNHSKILKLDDQVNTLVLKIEADNKKIQMLVGSNESLGKEINEGENKIEDYLESMEIDYGFIDSEANL